MANSALTATRMDASPDIRCRLERVICDHCTGECWSLEVWAHDLAGSGEKVCVQYAPHLTSLALATGMLGRMMMAVGSHLRMMAAERYVREHQPALFDLP